MNVIKKINASDTYPIRHDILRKGKSIDSCKFIGDDDENSIHLGCYSGEKLIGIVSLFLVKNENFNQEKQYQLRGMAVLEEFQKYGIGTELILAAEKEITKLNTSLLWFNAREAAVPFYLKLNYKTFGTKFEINGIGSHYRMFKQLETI